MASPAEGSSAVIHIGLDLGTTHSAIAYQIYKPVGNPISGGRTPIHRGKKTPTVVLLDKNKDVIPSGWDYPAALLPPGCHRLEWFKLMMLHMDDLADFKNSGKLVVAESNVRRLGLRVVDVISLYLGQLWGRFKSRVEAQLSGVSLEEQRVYLTVTTPVNWPSDAIGRMKQAMRDAGIRHEPMILTEPEAASLAVLPDVFNEVSAKDGDAFIICDCGGATVDSVAFQAAKSSKFSLSQCIPNDCIFAGATLLDSAFTSLLLTKLRAQSLVSISPTQSQALDKVTNQWWEETVKIDFCHGYQPPPFVIRDLSGAQPQVFEVAISGQEIAIIFDLIVGRILKLVDSQIRAVKAATGELPKAVILVGGFGRNNYLRAQVHGSVEQEHGGAVKTISYGNDVGWYSVAEGGAKHAMVASQSQNLPLDVIVDKRLSRARYGIRHTNGDWNWFVEVGTRLSAQQPDLFEVPRQAFKSVNATSTPTLILEIYTQPDANAFIQRACLLRWFTLPGSQYRGPLQLGLTHDGLEPRFAFYVDGQLQDPTRASFQYAP
ncbi:hypothetical protein EDB81DRAFT_907902 [Dactylonectria macrodidyma]|uniref:Actin-like ATPase domain-containing protein n=1 Tax=Dactylonectria macrodidyma TaxID=307937 RepID=A0A9P9IQJ9_9HYPO|nr:hypothetical protein EDB81DRAFT_907902 [Dactylonectria macrodidyma]